jgi:hypothetical protein
MLKTFEFYKIDLQNLDSKELKGQNPKNKGVSDGLAIHPRCLRCAYGRLIRSLKSRLDVTAARIF